MMIKRYVVAAVFVLLALSVALVAQAQVVVPRGQTFTVEWNSQYPNDTAMQFMVWVDTTQTKVFAPTELTAVTAPVADCPVPAGLPAATTCFLYRGTHPALQNVGTRSLSLAIRETATQLISPRSPSVSFVVGTVPNPPTNPRVVVVTTQAGVTFEFKSVPVTVASTSAAQPTTTVRIPVQR